MGIAFLVATLKSKNYVRIEFSQAFDKIENTLETNCYCLEKLSNLLLLLKHIN